MKVVNPLSKILIIIELTFGLMFSTNCMSAQNTSPLCFTARNGKVVVRFSIRNITHTIQYSTNGTTWNNYTSNSNVTVNSNHSIYFRAAANQSVATAFGAGGSLSNCSRFYFTSTNGGTIEASGNIMSLYGPDCPDLPLQQYAFYQMFYQCGLLTAAPELPATTLAENCYGSMFYYCTSLTSAPALPATALARSCYYNMFYYCTSLTAAPALPATTLAPNCYNYMFIGCTSLAAAPALPADTLAESCYSDMFNGCTSLAIAPALPATTLADSCYNSMFFGCTSLAAAPALPATNMAKYCYYNMFHGCTSLTVAPALPATTLAPYCYGRMFTDCTSLTAAPALSADTLARWCYNNMFSGCSSLARTPDLPATALAPNCYNYMFSSCTSLIAPPVLPATTLADSCYFRMFRGCSSMVVNIAPPGINWIIPAPSSAPAALTQMFSGTGGTMNGTPRVQTTYYIASGILTATALANDSAMGSVSGSGLYLIGDTVTMSATPNGNYSFVCWSNGATTPVISFIIDRDTTLTAIFTLLPTCLFEDSAAICQGGSYLWRGRNLTAAGVYYDSLHTSVVCDSVYKLTLTVNPTYFIQESHAICPGESYLWHGRNLTTAGVYYDSLQTAAGCDSVHKLTLTVNPTYFIEESHSICQGDNYPWHGRILTTAGVYYDSLQTKAGCDSVHKLTLTVNPTYFIEESHTICQGDSYTWHGRTLTTTGLYYDSLLTTAGCDSIHKLTLTLNPTYYIQENHAICPGESYLWHGRNLTTAGVYYDSLQTTAGCDSVHKLTLTVNQTYFIEESHSICQGDNYPWHGKNLTIAGVYFDSLQTKAGCDSVHKLTLTVNPTYFIEESHVICQGDSYTWHGRTLTTTGIYYDSLLTTAGCDSTHKLTLTVNPKYLFSDNASICPGESYSWHGRNLTTAGVYYDSLQTIAGCDSIHKLTLTVNPTYFIEENHSICQDDNYPWHGRILTTAGVYFDSLQTRAGCDSVHKLTLTVNPTYFIEESHVICQGDSYTWHGRTLTTTGLYYDSLLTTAGCDSIHKLTLTVNPTYYIQENHAICPGESYLWHGRNLTAAGVYYDSLQTTAGCDSVHKLTLTVNQTYFIEESHSICQGDNYPWHGRNLTTAGVYYDSLQTKAGCDSVHKLTLTVNPTYFIEESHVICQGDSYTWHGRTLTTTGIYYDSLQTAAGCDSIHKLTLTVNPTYYIQESHAICPGESYSWHGRNLTAAGAYYDSLQTIAGCDSVHKLTLTVNPTYFIEENHSICQGDNYPWHGRILTIAGVYYDSLQTGAGCDSVHKLTLTVNPTYFIEESHVICQGDSYTWHGRTLTTTGVYFDSLQTASGCDSVYELTLTVNPSYLIQQTQTINQGDSLTWHGRTLTTTGIYYDSLLTTAGCDSIYKLTLTVNHSYLFEDSVTICRGDIYPWRGQNITAAGVYYDSLITSAGFDSVYTLTVSIRQHDVTLNVNDPAMGSVTGDGTYECGEKVQITATAADSCHSFDHWSDGDASNPRTFVIKSDTSFTAIFRKNVYTVTVSPSNVRGGTAYCITDSGKDSTITVECGETVEIHAESTDNYHFAGWSDGGTDSIRTITVTSDTDIVAIFNANCGDMTHWPVEFKFNNLLIVNLNALNAEGYYPRPDRISWYMVSGGVDAVEGATFPMDDQFVCTGYYLSLIANGLNSGKYYAIIDASLDIGTPCTGKMKSEIIEYIPGSQQIRIEVAPTEVRNGDQVTVSGLTPDETSIVRVYDYTGRVMQTIATSGTEQCQIQAAATAGVYMINVTSETVNETFRFVVTK